MIKSVRPLVSKFQAFMISSMDLFLGGWGCLSHGGDEVMCPRLHTTPAGLWDHCINANKYMDVHHIILYIIVLLYYLSLSLSHVYGSYSSSLLPKDAILVGSANGFTMFVDRHTAPMSNYVLVGVIQPMDVVIMLITGTNYSWSATTSCIATVYRQLLSRRTTIPTNQWFTSFKCLSSFTMVGHGW